MSAVYFISGHTLIPNFPGPPLLFPMGMYALAPYNVFFLTKSSSLSFASITATLMHALLYFRKQIWIQARRSLHEQADIHARLMARYPQG